MMIISILVLLGVSIFALTLYSSGKYYDEGVTYQSLSISRLLKIFMGRELAELERKNGELGSFILSDSAFRNLSKTVIADSGNTEAQTELLALLDAQFNQKFVTTGVLKLNKIRIYTKDLKFVVNSQGEKAIGTELSAELRSLDEGRQGAERMKRVSALWSTENGIPQYSTLLPIGGLRLVAYLEVITDPIYQYRGSAALVGLPTAIRKMDKQFLFNSEDWDDAKGENILPVQHVVKSVVDTPVFVLEGREDFTEYNKHIAKTEYTVLLIYLVLLVGSTFVSLSVLKRTVFLPMKQMIATLKKIGEGDLTVQTHTGALKELSHICRILNTIIESLRAQVHEVSDYSESLLVKERGLNVIAGTVTQTLGNQEQDIQAMASAVNEMTYSIQEVAKNATTTAKHARAVDDDAQKGAVKAQNSLEYMATLHAEMEQASSVIGQLGTQSDGISMILDTIKGIAEQTNLLALNAAIEAARAGEQGRGFAVVADEVRSLAQKTQESTQDIEERIQGLQDVSRNAIEVMHDAVERSNSSKSQVEEISQILSEISTMISAVNDQTTQIASAVEEQTKVSELIGNNVSNVSDQSRETLDMAKQVGREADEVKDISERLKKTISHFSI